MAPCDYGIQNPRPISKVTIVMWHDQIKAYFRTTLGYSEDESHTKTCQTIRKRVRDSGGNPN